VRVCCGCRFPDREIEEPFRVLRADNDNSRHGINVGEISIFDTLVQ
jgi:hypothetical protein